MQRNFQIWKPIWIFGGGVHWLDNRAFLPLSGGSHLLNIWIFPIWRHIVMIFTPGTVQSCENLWELLRMNLPTTKTNLMFFSYRGIRRTCPTFPIEKSFQSNDREVIETLVATQIFFEPCSPQKLGKMNPIWRTDFSDGLKTTNYPWTPKPRKMKENPQYMGYNP